MVNAETEAMIIGAREVASFEIKYVFGNNGAGEGYYIFAAPWTWGAASVAGPFATEKIATRRAQLLYLIDTEAR